MHDSEWSPNEKDLAVMEAITSHHLEKSDGRPLGVFEVKIGVHEKIDIRMSEWMSEIVDYFTAEYGQDIAAQFVKKVISNSIIGNETLH